MTISRAPGHTPATFMQVMPSCPSAKPGQTTLKPAAGSNPRLSTVEIADAHGEAGGVVEGAAGRVETIPPGTTAATGDVVVGGRTAGAVAGGAVAGGVVVGTAAGGRRGRTGWGAAFEVAAALDGDAWANMAGRA